MAWLLTQAVTAENWALGALRTELLANVSFIPLKQNQLDNKPPLSQNIVIKVSLIKGRLPKLTCLKDFPCLLCRAFKGSREGGAETTP